MEDYFPFIKYQCKKFIVTVYYCDSDESCYISPEMKLYECYPHIIELLSRTALDDAFSVDIRTSDGEIFQRIYQKGVNLIV